MDNQTNWIGIGTTVPGNSHKRANKPNQDAIGILPASRSGLPIVLAVADGHGSKRAFRSEIGSRLAVEAIVKILWDCGTSSDMRYDLVHQLTQQQLPELIEREWGKRVDEHLAEHQFDPEESQYLLTEAEASKLKSRQPLSGAQVKSIINRYPYGSPILAALVTELYILYVQLGDGDIVCIDDRGEAYRPIAKDERLIANETTSLCQLDAWQEFRMEMQPNTSKSPVAILISTDGFINCYESEEIFLAVCKDYYRWVKQSGIREVEVELEALLLEATEKGSGDDITLGILSRIVTEPSNEQQNPEGEIELIPAIAESISEVESADLPEESSSTVEPEPSQDERKSQVQVTVKYTADRKD